MDNLAIFCHGAEKVIHVGHIQEVRGGRAIICDDGGRIYSIPAEAAFVVSDLVISTWYAQDRNGWRTTATTKGGKIVYRGPIRDSIEEADEDTASAKNGRFLGVVR